MVCPSQFKATNRRIPAAARNQAIYPAKVYWLSYSNTLTCVTHYSELTHVP